jgi:hypothetical protein
MFPNIGAIPDQNHTISAFATADHKKLATCNKLNGAEEAQEHFGESREKELLRADRPDS